MRALITVLVATSLVGCGNFLGRTGEKTLPKKADKTRTTLLLALHPLHA